MAQVRLFTGFHECQVKHITATGLKMFLLFFSSGPLEERKDSEMMFVDLGDGEGEAAQTETGNEGLYQVIKGRVFKTIITIELLSTISRMLSLQQMQSCF